MLPLRKVLQSIEKGLEDLNYKTKEMHKLLDSIESALIAEQPKTRTAAFAKKSRKKPAKRATGKKTQAKKTATDAVLNTITRSRKGATTAQIKKKTGLSEKQIWNIINRAKRMGKIKSEKQGLYVKV